MASVPGVIGGQLVPFSVQEFRVLEKLTVRPI
jgi:hypothetical protein